MTSKTCTTCRIPGPVPPFPPTPKPIDLCNLTFASDIKLSFTGSFQNEAGLLEPFQIVDRLIKFKKFGNLVDVDLGVDSKGRPLKFFGILYRHLDHVDLLATSDIIGNAKFEFVVEQVVNSGSRSDTYANIVTDIIEYSANGQSYRQLSSVENLLPAPTSSVSAVCWTCKQE